MADPRRGQWLKGVLDLCVLGVLVGGDVYGYELARRLEDTGLGPIKGGTLYPILSRLETDGYVETYWMENDQGPDRKYYRPTTAGRDLLGEVSLEWEAFNAAAAALMSRTPEAAG